MAQSAECDFTSYGSGRSRPLGSSASQRPHWTSPTRSSTPPDVYLHAQTWTWEEEEEAGKEVEEEEEAEEEEDDEEDEDEEVEGAWLSQLFLWVWRVPETRRSSI